MRRWQKKEVTYLKRYAKSRRVDELAERFDTDKETVLAKLEELGLSAKDSVTRIRLANDPAIATLEKGLKALAQNKWKEASRHFQQVVDECDRARIVQRALGYLEICREHMSEPPSDDDPFVLAVYERNRGHLDDALEICMRGGRQGKDDRFAYLAASILALRDEREKAAEVLAKAIELNPRNRGYAALDADFSELRDDEEYAALFEQD